MSLLPLQLPPQAIDEFQALWKQTYGTEIPREQATVRAHQLIALLQLLTDGTVTEEQLTAAMSKDLDAPGESNPQEVPPSPEILPSDSR